ncbi:MAG: ABC transporter permease [Terriglobia bacterium]
MHKIWLLIKREYKTRVASRGFLISTIAIPVIFGGLILFQVAVSKEAPARPYRIAVLDETGRFGPSISAGLSSRKLPDGRPMFLLTEIADPSGSGDQPRDELDAMTRDGSLDGYLRIPKDVESGGQPELVEANAGLLNAAGDLGKIVNDSILTARLRAYGISAPRMRALLRTPALEVTRLTKTGKTEEKGQAYIIAIVMASILYVALLMYGVTTMQSVLEEKTTRTMEVLVSSVRPVQLMIGKILGVAAVGVTQFLIWAVSAGVLAAWGLSLSHAFRSGAAGFHLHIPGALLVYFVVFFLGGYLLFASMYAAIGASVSDQNDARQLQTPVTIILVASFFLFSIIMRDPNSPAAVLLTLIPFFSPILMVFRIALQPPPFWQIGLSLAILFVTMAGVVYGSARIYRVGVLMYGKRPSVLEVLKWMRYP